MAEPSFTLAEIESACAQLVRDGLDELTVRLIRDELCRELRRRTNTGTIHNGAVVRTPPVRPSPAPSAPAPAPRPRKAPSPAQAALFSTDDLATTAPRIPTDEADLAAFIRRRLGDFTPSPYQMAIFRFILTGQGDAIIGAVAGSGKTSTLLAASKLLTTKEAMFVSFGKDIVNSLAQRLKGSGMRAVTLHGLGHQALIRHFNTKRITVDQRKYTTLIEDWLATAPALTDPEDAQVARGALRDLLNLVRLTLTDPTDLPALVVMMQHFGIELAFTTDPSGTKRRAVFAAIPVLLATGEQVARNAHIIDHADQLYLPVHFQLKLRGMDWIFADECQDMNAAQLALLLRARAPGGRMIFVGDERQAIYGFAGASARSYRQIQEVTQATELPLSICYRCPASHIRLAQTIVPQIEPRPQAPEGVIGDLRRDQALEQVAVGDLVICRLNASLVNFCLQLIGKGKKAYMKGRDIGKLLTAIVHEVAALPGFHYAAFGRLLADYAHERITRLAQFEGNEGLIASFMDRIESIRIIAQERPEVVDTRTLCAEIEHLFEEDTDAILCSSVHRAKGQEAKTVFLIEPERMPLEWPKQQLWELEQEFNIRYVALTRAKQTLWFVA
ncbi:MAG: ATP-dependent helicase [Ktedonobacterales bacterium]|nr:ATP-dependent helicase [Ktedonobacterales bacterium]